MRDAETRDAGALDRASDPETLRRRARLCRQQAEATEHARLAAAFIGLAAALELAASVADSSGRRRMLH